VTDDVLHRDVADLVEFVEQHLEQAFADPAKLAAWRSMPVYLQRQGIADGAYDDPIPIRLRGQRKAWLTLPKPFRDTDKATLIAAIQSIVADDEEAVAS
jgi:hypothetical protein